MKLARILTIILLMVLIAFFLNACSKGKSPVEPVIDNSPEMPQDIPDFFGTGLDQRKVLSVYDCVMDPDAKTFAIEPTSRSGEYHFPLTQLYPNVLQITDYGWTPNFWADIRLSHPLPGSGIDAFDPRVIAILPANPGVRFIYPVMGVGGNNAVVLKADGYMKLFDELGGSILGNVNPFVAYFKDVEYRRWSSTGTTQETKRWQMDILGFGGPIQFKLVVDVSTNYPNPPQPIIDNASEPIEIDANVGLGLTNQGGSAPIEIRLKHWKDISDVGGVLVEVPDLFSNTMPIQYYSYSQYYGASVFKGMLTNEKLATEGNYNLLAKSWDSVTGIQMFNEFNVVVSYLTDRGNLIWAKRAGGSGYDYGRAITTLSDNSTVVTGYFYGPAIFGQGESNETVLDHDHIMPVGNVFIARYNPDGTLAWAKQAGGVDRDSGYAVTSLSDDSTVVTGAFKGTATFGKDEINETILISTGNDDIFIARFNSDGTLAWAKKAGGVNQDFGLGITTLSDNSTVVTGLFWETAIFGLGEPNETILNSTYHSGIFIARYNPDGSLIWAKLVGGSGDYDSGDAITTLSDDSIVITGDFFGAIRLGEGEPNETILYSVGMYDIFIARYNQDGTLSWANCAGGSNWDSGYAITRLSDNSTIVTGTYCETATFGEGEPNEEVLTSAGSQDIFIVRYDSSGSVVWAKSAGGPEWDVGYGIAALTDNTAVVTGYFWGLSTFGSGETNQTVLVSTGNEDIFISQYNPDGTLDWAKCSGGSNSENGWAIASLPDDSTVITGEFMYTATFGPGETNETNQTSAGHGDIFIARFEP